MAKKSQSIDTLVQVFSSKDMYYVKSMMFTLESMMYQFYSNNVPDNVVLFSGVRADWREVKDLELSNFCPMYDNYVKAIKKKDGFYGINLEFVYELKEGEEDEL